MKKKINIVFVLLIISSLLLTACNSDDKNKKTTDAIDIHFPEEIVKTAFNSLDEKHLESIKAREGVHEANINEDGSFSLKVTDKVRREMMEGMIPAIDAAMTELREIKLASKIAHSDNYSKFELVNPDGKEFFLDNVNSAKIGLDWIGQRVVTYQGYAAEDIGLEFTVKDDKGELIGVYNYPEDFTEQINNRIDMLEDKKQ